jgi:cytochrome c peroxidase
MECLRMIIVTIVAFTAGITVAAEGDAVALKQAQEIFRPLPKDVGTAEPPITKARVDLGRMLSSIPVSRSTPI